MHTNLHTQLPYELCDGVVATVEGIEPSFEKLELIDALTGHTAKVTNGPRRRVNGHGVDWRTYLSWEDAQKVLSYKPQQPGVALIQNLYKGIEVQIWHLIPWHYGMPSNNEVGRLHRTACLLFDDAEGFMVLYQCIKEFGG